MADEVSYNPTQFQTTDAGDLALKAVERAWPYTGVSLSQGNGLKFDAQGLFVDVPPKVSCLDEVWNAADGSGDITITDQSTAPLPIPAVTAPRAVERVTAAFGGWEVTCWYRLDPAATDTGYVTLALSADGRMTSDVLASSGTLRGPTGMLAAFVPVDGSLGVGETFTTAPTAIVGNHTGGAITVDYRARMAAYLLEGVSADA